MKALETVVRPLVTDQRTNAQNLYLTYTRILKAKHQIGIHREKSACPPPPR